MTKTVKDVKRPSPKRKARALRYLWVSLPITKEWVTAGKRPRGETLDLRRNEWKRLKRGPKTAAALERIGQIERAWEQMRKAA